MQYLFIIIINILIASVFYLIITIKLERSANDYRSRRLKKEIEELIDEFNMVAERNLSLLEYKINVLKNLLKQSGLNKGIDIIIDDKKNDEKLNTEASLNNIKKNIDLQYAKTSNDINKKMQAEMDNEVQIDENHKSYEYKVNESKNQNKLVEDSNVNNTLNDQIKELFLLLYAKIKNKLINSSIMNKINKRENMQYEAKNDIIYKDKIYNNNNDIYEQSEFEGNQKLNIDKNYETNIIKNEDLIKKDVEELKKMFFNANNKYDLIHDLYDKGYSPEILSKASGISVGEIELVLNISK